MILTDYLGRDVNVQPEMIEAELKAVLEAVEYSCSETGTAPHLENLRRARGVLARRVWEVAQAAKFREGME